jgi:glycosyltransferase involved in cell wall biosynthesis
MVLQRYAKVGAFVCLSDHEGFGIPLIEAMASGIPVFAYRTAAIPETMDGVGILLESKDPVHVATSIHQVLSNKHIQQTTVSLQNARVTRLQEFDANQFWLDFINGRSSDSIQLQIQGPLDSSYSLAVLNRNLANALDQISDFTVSARQTEGPGDYISTTEDKVQELISTEIASRARNVLYPDVVIRQMYPPRLDDSTARFTIQYFGWEESRIPNSIVEKFNSHADGVIVMSQFVKTALESSGVTCPIFTVGVGVNQPDLQTTHVVPELKKLRKTRFLNISSGFPRKGLDCLITSYFNTFTGEDDVTLIIKTFPNQHNNVADLLLQAKSQAVNPPHVIWVDRDLNESELGALYQNASAYVNASRGEGFGLPVAEAMLCRIPVISTANSGLTDFVSERTATVISSSLVNAKSHVSEALSQWYEPNVAELERELKKFVHSDPASYQEAIDNAERFIKDKFSWTEVAARTEQAVKQIMIHKHPLRLTLITTFNSRCGIAEYSQYLADHLSKSISTDFIADSSSWPLDLIAEESLQRLWKQNKQQDLSELISAIEISDAELVHVQHSFAFFSSHDLARLVHEVQKTRPVVITFHRTKDTPIDSIRNERDAMQRAAAIVVHERHDVEFLAYLGISKNVHLIPIGALRNLATTVKTTSQNSQMLHIGTFGFLLPHKGLATLIRAIQILKENGLRVHLTALCAIHPDPSSAREHQRCVTLMRELNLTSEITLVTDYLDQDEIHKKLSETDILVLPYDQTAESSSGVLAMLLSLEKPIIASDIDIFSGSRDCLVLIPATPSPDDLVDRITNLYSNESERIDYSHSVHRRYVDTSWSRVAQMHETLYRSILHAFNTRKLPF